MPSGGYLVNDTEPTGVGTSFSLTKIILMHEDTSEEGSSLHGALPAQARLEQIDLRLTVTSGAPTQAKVMVWYDAAGNEPCVGPSSFFTLTTCLTATGDRAGTVSVLTAPRIPRSVQTTGGKLYLSVLVDVGEVTVTRARIHWRDDRSE